MRAVPSRALATMYGLHVKVYLLSWAKQLVIEERKCADQGHHRQQPGRQSIRLYSRDDVWGALMLQWIIKVLLFIKFRRGRMVSTG